LHDTGTALEPVIVGVLVDAIWEPAGGEPSSDGACDVSSDDAAGSDTSAAAPESITNNQEQGVDEGDIVKVVDGHVVVLRQGRGVQAAPVMRSVSSVGRSSGSRSPSIARIPISACAARARIEKSHM